MVGAATECSEAVEQLLEVVPFTHLVMHDLGASELVRIAEQVMPHFSG